MYRCKWFTLSFSIYRRQDNLCIEEPGNTIWTKETVKKDSWASPWAEGEHIEYVIVPICMLGMYWNLGSGLLVPAGTFV